MGAWLNQSWKRGFDSPLETEGKLSGAASNGTYALEGASRAVQPPLEKKKSAQAPTLRPLNKTI